MRPFSAPLADAQAARLERDIQTNAANLDDAHTRICRMLDCSYIHAQALATSFVRACVQHGIADGEMLKELSLFHETVTPPRPRTDPLEENVALISQTYRQMTAAEQICFYRALARDVETDASTLSGHLLGNVEPIESFARGTVIYHHNIYADEAFLHFSRVLPTAKACYSDSFTGVCEQVLSGQCEYCILPLENTQDGKLVRFYGLIEKYELKIMLTCSVTTSDKSQSTVFGLCRRGIQYPLPYFSTKDKSLYFEFVFWQEPEHLSMSTLLTAAECCSLSLVRSDCLPRSDEEILIGAGHPFNLCFEIPAKKESGQAPTQQDLLAFLMYLSVHSPTYLPLGIYQRL